MASVPPEVWEAISYAIVAIVSWLVPGPNRRHRNRSVQIHRRKDDVV